MTGSYQRKQFVGGAVSTTLNGAISDSATTVVISDATGWPDATNPFVATIDRGLATEEKVLVTARSTTTLTATRAYDNTVAVAHSTGATIDHTIDASTIDQANRFVNLQTGKADLVVHNGTIAARVPGPAFASGSDDSFDEHVLMVDVTEGAGVKYARPVHITFAASAPAVDGVQRLWFDENTGMIRSSDGSTWLVPSTIPLVADTSARDAYFGSPPPESGVACLVGTSGSVQLQVFDGTIWQRFPRLDEGIPKFADATARDAYYTSPATGDHAYLTGTDQFFEYREDEWILLNRKITVSETAPASPHDGDIWLQPTS